MIQLLMLLALGTFQGGDKQIQPCVWPRTCRAEQVAQVTTCQWPNVCDRAG